MTELVILTPEQQVAAVLAQDARRVRRLTWLVAGLWKLTLLATLLMTALTHERLRERPAPRAIEMDTGRKSSPGELREIDQDIRLAGLKVAVALVASDLLVVVGLVSVSALGTLSLIHAGRRATARQIQAGLADISKQLAALRQTAGPPPAEGTRHGV